ncbi:hypothetical protein ACLOJK_012530 [Asimina triloba]
MARPRRTRVRRQPCSPYEWSRLHMYLSAFHGTCVLIEHPEKDQRPGLHSTCGNSKGMRICDGIASGDSLDSSVRGVDLESRGTRHVAAAPRAHQAAFRVSRFSAHRVETGDPPPPSFEILHVFVAHRVMPQKDYTFW